MCRNTVYFTILIMSAAILLSLYSTSRSFSYIENNIICKQRQFYFFTSEYNFFFFLANLYWARTSGTILDRCDERIYCYLGPNLRDKTCIFSLLKMMLVVGFQRCPLSGIDVGFHNIFFCSISSWSYFWLFLTWLMALIDFELYPKFAFLW